MVGRRATRRMRRLGADPSYFHPPASSLLLPPSALDESFVVLAGASQMLGPGSAPAGSLLPRAPLAARFAAHAAAFQLAADDAGADADVPLCGECAARVAAELDAEAGAAAADADALEAAAVRAAARVPGAARAAADAARAELAAAVARAATAAAAEAAATADLAAARAAADAVSEAERAYWHALNDAQATASTLTDDAAAAAGKARRAAAALDDLRSRDAVSDLHRIARAGPYATLAGCRAGRGPGIGWDETNAAVGGAVRLLATLCRLHSISLTSCLLLPAGSTPRVADGRGGAPVDVYGPVNKLYCGGYDRGLALFAAGVAEFAAAAADADARSGRAPLALPYAVEGDKVGGLVRGKGGGWRVEGVAAALPRPLPLSSSSLSRSGSCSTRTRAGRAPSNTCSPTSRRARRGRRRRARARWKRAGAARRPASGDFCCF